MDGEGPVVWRSREVVGVEDGVKRELTDEEVEEQLHYYDSLVDGDMEDNRDKESTTGNGHAFHRSPVQDKVPHRGVHRRPGTRRRRRVQA